MMAQSLKEWPVLNLDQIGQGELNVSPFPWVSFAGTFCDLADAASLRESFPVEGYRDFCRTSGNKRHVLSGHSLNLGNTGSHGSSELGPLWTKLISELKSVEYRRAVERRTGLDLKDLGLEVTLWRQTPGGFVDPHPDHPGKVVIHLIYLGQESWTKEDGGCLRILRSNNIDDVAAEIPPCIGNSIIFLRSDSSWHGYIPVKRQELVRLAIQVVFHSSELKYGE